APNPAPSPDVLVFDRVSYTYPGRDAVAVPSLSNIASASAGMSGFLSSIALTRLETIAESAAPEQPTQVLSHISFPVRPGETVAIAGHSGSGKSTIISLACGSIRPTSGRVSVVGLDTTELAEEDVWRYASLVSQDVYLRDASLRDNLRYGLEDATDDRLADA